MNDRIMLLESIAGTIKDYRAGEIKVPTPEHVDRWVTQFEKKVQVPLLREFDHVLKETYLSRQWVSDWLTNLVKTQKLVGADPCSFWSEANFLRIQQNGYSQEEMLEVFGKCLTKECGFAVDECGGSDCFIYLDDAIFSGGRVGNDLAAWIEREAPASATVHVVVVAIHKLGGWQLKKR